MAKKLTQVLLVTAVAVMTTLGLAACGASATATPTPQPTATATPIPGATATPTAAAPTATPTPSFDAAAYFKGKTITLVVPYGAGGGTDIIARALATQWSQFIPGNPRIEVVNKTPQTAGLNYVWQSKPDGFTLGTLSAASWYQLKYQQGANYSAEGFSVLGAVSKSDFAILVRNDVPYTNLQQAIGGTYPLKQGLGNTDPSQLQGQDVALMWLADNLNLPLKEYGITNFNSSSTALVAFEAGEVNILTRNGGGGWAGLPTTRPGWEADGFVKQLVSMTTPGTTPTTSPEGGPWTAGNVVDYMTAAQKATWLGMLPYPSFDKPYVMPPGGDPNVVKALQDSFWQTMQDPTAQAAMKKAMGGIPFDPVNGADATAETVKNAKIFDETYPKIATTAQLQAWVTKYVQ